LTSIELDFVEIQGLEGLEFWGGGCRPGIWGRGGSRARPVWTRMLLHIAIRKREAIA